MFTTNGQIENRITRTTQQTVKHGFYSNQEFTIVGSDNFKLWKKTGSSVSLIEVFSNIEEAVEAGNKLVTTL